MNDYVIVIIAFTTLIAILYALRTFYVRVLANDLYKQSEALRIQISRATKLLNEFEDEPEEIFQQGLMNSGLGSILTHISVTPEMLKALGVPTWAMPIAMPMAKGFIENMRKRAIKNATDQVDSTQIQERPSQV
jgi:hypothetical protein